MACILAVLACSVGRREGSAAAAMPALKSLVWAVSSKANPHGDLAGDLPFGPRPSDALSGLVSQLQVPGRM